MRERSSERPTADEPERAVIVAVLPQGTDPGRETEELRELLRTAHADTAATVVQHRERPDRRTYVGKGKVEEVKETVEQVGARSW